MSFNTDTTLRRRRANVLSRRSRTEGPAGRHLQRRQKDDPVEPGPPLIPPTPSSVPPKVITLTQVRTLSTLQGTTVASITTKRTTTSSSSSRSTSSTSSTSTSITPILSSPTDSITPTPSGVALPPTSTAGSDASNNDPGTAVNQRGGLSSGAIAGIAITVVVVIAAVIAFLVRRRMIASRAERREDWAGRGAFSAPPPPPQMQQQSPGMMWNQSVEYGAASSAATAAPFATTYRPESLIPGTGQLASAVPYQPSAVPVERPASAITPAYALSPEPMLPVPGAGAVPATSKSLRVRCTFLPSMADELPIVTGELISIVQEYDDGWALCRNASGQQGMVPLECLYETDENDRNLRRASSLRSN